MGILVIDAGTSGVRAAIVGPDASVHHEVHRATLPDSPMPGLVEFDATPRIFTNPSRKQTEDYVTGRFG